MSEPVVSVTEGSVWWYCPGCKMPHRITTAGPVVWEFNGDLVKPTFSPSVRTRHTYVDGVPSVVCHIFVREGRIEFLSDCTHGLAGQTVDMVPWDGWPE